MGLLLDNGAVYKIFTIILALLYKFFIKNYCNLPKDIVELWGLSAMKREVAAAMQVISVEYVRQSGDREKRFFKGVA